LGLPSERLRGWGGRGKIDQGVSKKGKEGNNFGKYNNTVKKKKISRGISKKSKRTRERKEKRMAQGKGENSNKWG